jgi:hypothetical protein
MLPGRRRRGWRMLVQGRRWVERRRREKMGGKEKGVTMDDVWILKR